MLIFTRTKHGANKLAEHLNLDGIKSDAIHGNKSKGARTRALADFKDGKLKALVATDIAACSLDIDQLPYVVNFELPQVVEDYVHRIGRTCRAVATGKEVSLVCVDEHGLLADIERLLKREIPRLALEGYAPDPSIKAAPLHKKPKNKARGSAPRSQSRKESNADSKSVKHAKNNVKKQQLLRQNHPVVHAQVMKSVIIKAHGQKLEKSFEGKKCELS